MTQSKKKWVFKELVKSGNDVQELIAYAIYKVKKDQLAESLRSEGKNEKFIQAELDNFHEQTLRVGLDDYRDKAQMLFLDVTTEAAELIVPLYEGEIKRLKKEHANDIKALTSKMNKLKKTATEDYIKKVNEYNISQKTWNDRYIIRPLKWACSGLPGILASAFTLGIIVMVMGYFAEPETRNLIITEGAKNVLKLLAPDQLISGLPEITKKNID